MRTLPVLVVAPALTLGGCGVAGGDDSGTTPTGEPQTLEAATASRQELDDASATGDWKRVYPRLSNEIRSVYTETEMTDMFEVCSGKGAPTSVATGVRLTDPTHAQVKVTTTQDGDSWVATMVYEDGRWHSVGGEGLRENVRKRTPATKIIEDCRAELTKAEQELKRSQATPPPSE